MLQEIGNLVPHGKVCRKSLQPGVAGLVSLTDMCDEKKDEMVIRQEVITKFGWERPHKGK